MAISWPVACVRKLWGCSNDWKIEKTNSARIAQKSIADVPLEEVAHEKLVGRRTDVEPWIRLT